jgi:uncharacterized Zn-finger protein
MSSKQQKIFYVKKSDLPLSCPQDDKELWSSHPRVFLPIDKTGTEVCPYCSAKYILQDD